MQTRRPQKPVDVRARIPPCPQAPTASAEQTRTGSPRPRCRRGARYQVPDRPSGWRPEEEEGTTQTRPVKLPWVALLAELDKRQLLCHPCHRAKSNEETTGPREHGTYQMYHRGKCRCGLCRAAFNTYRRGWRLRSGRTTRSYGPRNTGIV